MNNLIVFQSTNNVDDFLYLLPLIKSNPEKMNVLFASGIPSDVCPHTVCSISEKSLLYKFSFDTNKRGYISRLGKYINENEIENIILFDCYIGEHHISHLIEQCPNVNIIFICNGNINETKQAIEDLKETNTIFVSTTNSVGQRILKGVRYFYIHGAVLYPDFADNDVRTNYRINKNEKIIGIIGNIDVMPMNNIIEAARLLKSVVIICGYGKTIAELSETVSVNRWPIIVVPFIPWARGNWYEAFNCFLNVCSYSGFPVFALEAALCNVPLVTSPVGDLYTILGDGRANFVVNTTNSIIQGLTGIHNINTEDVSKFVREMYSLSKYIASWEELFDIIKRKEMDK